MSLLIIIFAIFFAVNMGGASFAASFAAPYGGNLIKQKKAAFLFIIFVVLGSYVLGENVSVTLGERIMPSELLDAKAAAIIFFSAGLSMFVSNCMKIPQSTSLVTVAAIAGVGAYYGKLAKETFYFLIPFWVVLPLISFLLTLLITSSIYPPRKGNFWIYERLINHQNKLKKFVILTSLYCAFAVGTNNVANVVGPIMAVTDALPLKYLLIGFACVYGLGAFVFTEPIKTAGHKIVPLGLMTASIISLVGGSLMLVASAFGVPQSFVMLQMGAIFAISGLKEGHESTFQKPLTKQTLYTWTINPIITFFIALGLSYAVIG